MKKLCIILTIYSLVAVVVNGQKSPTGNPADFRVKTCLHSVSYMGIWCGQATLTVDEFLLKAKELGFHGVMLAAKRPHVSLIDYDEAARKKLRSRIKNWVSSLSALQVIPISQPEWIKQEYLRLS